MFEPFDNVALPTDQSNIISTPEDQHSNLSDRNDSTFNFQPLETFLGPVNKDDVLTEPEAAMVDNPIFYSSHNFRDNQDLMT